MTFPQPHSKWQSLASKPISFRNFTLLNFRGGGCQKSTCSRSLLSGSGMPLFPWGVGFECQAISSPPHLFLVWLPPLLCWDLDSPRCWHSLTAVWPLDWVQALPVLDFWPSGYQASVICPTDTLFLDLSLLLWGLAAGSALTFSPVALGPCVGVPPCIALPASPWLDHKFLPGCGPFTPPPHPHS